MWSVLTVDCYLTIESNEIPARATTWMPLRNIMVSEKTTYCRTPMKFSV